MSLPTLDRTSLYTETGGSLQNKEFLCHTEPQPAQSQKLQLLRGLPPRFLMTPAVTAPFASQWHPTFKKIAAPRGTALTPRCLPQNGAHEESWMKKVTWPLCEINLNKVQTECSEMIAIWNSLPPKWAKYRREIAKPLAWVTLVTQKRPRMLLYVVCYPNPQHYIIQYYILIF